MDLAEVAQGINQTPYASKHVFYYGFKRFFSPDFDTVWRCVSFLHLCNLKTKKFLGLAGHSQLGQSMLLCVKV